MTGFQVNKPAVAMGHKGHQAAVTEELTVVVCIMMRKMICTAREFENHAKTAASCMPFEFVNSKEIIYCEHN